MPDPSLPFDVPQPCAVSGDDILVLVSASGRFSSIPPTLAGLLPTHIFFDHTHQWIWLWRFPLVATPPASFGLSAVGGTGACYAVVVFQGSAGGLYGTTQAEGASDSPLAPGFDPLPPGSFVMTAVTYPFPATMDYAPPFTSGVDAFGALNGLAVRWYVEPGTFSSGVTFSLDTFQTWLCGEAAFSAEV